jgi:hypothetical protein
VQAYTLIEDMKVKIANVNIAYYINMDTVKAIEQAAGVQLIGKLHTNQRLALHCFSLLSSPGAAAG